MIQYDLNKGSLQGRRFPNGKGVAPSQGHPGAVADDGQRARKEQQVLIEELGQVEKEEKMVSDVDMRLKGKDIGAD